MANYPATAIEVDAQNRPGEAVHVPGTVGPINARGSSATTTDVNGVTSTAQQVELTINGVVASATTDGQAAANTPLVALGGFNGTTVDREYLPVVYKNIAAQAVTAGTPVGIWTPAAGKKFHLMGWNLSLSVAGGIIFKDGGNSSAEIIRPGFMPAGQANVSNFFGNGFAGAANAGALQIDVSATGTCNGYVFGVEF